MNEQEFLDLGVVQDSTLVELEPGPYLVELREVGKHEHPEYGVRLRWVFAVYDLQTQQPLHDELGSPVTIWEFTSPNPSKRGKLVAWLEALLARELKAGEHLGRALAEAIGRRGRAYVTRRQNGRGNKLVSLDPLAPAVAGPVRVARAGH